MTVPRLLARPTRPGLAGLALLLAWTAWAFTSALLAGRVLDPTSPYVLSPLVLAAGVATGALVAARVRGEVVIAGIVVVTTVLLLGVIRTEGPAKGPTGYANANAALAVQVIGLCGLAMLRADRVRRVVLWATAAAALAVVVANASRAAAVVAVPLLATIAVMTWRPARRARWAVLLGAGTALALGAGVVHLAGRDTWPPRVVTALDPARQSLWADAMALWSAHPVAGGGPGSFASASALGGDPDTASAHSSVLQVGAETGWVGVVLLALLVLAGLLWAARGDAPHAVVAAAAWTALVAHSLTDHLLEYAPIVLLAGSVVGWAAAVGSEELDVAEREGPVPR